jgi:hypothetical protein
VEGIIFCPLISLLHLLSVITLYEVSRKSNNWQCNDSKKSNIEKKQNASTYKTDPKGSKKVRPKFLLYSIVIPLQLLQKL